MVKAGGWGGAGAKMVSNLTASDRYRIGWLENHIWPRSCPISELVPPDNRSSLKRARSRRSSHGGEVVHTLCFLTSLRDWKITAITRSQSDTMLCTSTSITSSAVKNIKLAVSWRYNKKYARVYTDCAECSKMYYRCHVINIQHNAIFGRNKWCRSCWQGKMDNKSVHNIRMCMIIKVNTRIW